MRWAARPNCCPIVEKGGGDYVLAVKSNQKPLSESIVERFETGETLGGDP